MTLHLSFADAVRMVEVADRLVPGFLVDKFVRVLLSRMIWDDDGLWIEVPDELVRRQRS